MLEILFNYQDNFIFSFFLTLSLSIIVLELALMLVGVSLSDTLDLDIDFPSVLSWLGFGKIPFIIWITFYLFISGILGSYLSYYLSDILFLPILAVTLVISLIINKVFSDLLFFILPKDESYAVSENSLIGLEAEITLGVCDENNEAEAKIITPSGETVYVMVSPFDSLDIFKEKSKVIIHLKHETKNLFYVIPNGSETL